MMKRNITLLNAVSSLILQLVTIISGFIIPKLILNTFGSNVNGLVSSLNQFLNYVTILEGGIGAVIMANFYKPLYDKNYKKMNAVLKTSMNFYKKLSYIFIGYTVLLALAYPIIFHTDFSAIYISSLAIILSTTIFIQYNFSISYKLLLTADKKVYLVSFIQTFLIILNTFLFWLLIKVYPEIHFLKFVSALVFLLQPIAYRFFAKKYYKINKNVEVDKELSKSRWVGFAISIAAFVHYNTDIAVLTFFTNLKTVSIYSVYSLVSNGLRSIITSFSAGIVPTMGSLYAKNNEKELNDFFSFYEYIVFVLVFISFSVGGLLIVPFVNYYTNNITDINYNQPLFALIILISESIFCLKEPYVNIAYSANKFKDIKKHAYIEATINIVVSIILVQKYGLLGVAIGTLLAMSYRTFFHVFYLKNNILNRKISYFFSKLVVFSVTSASAIFLCMKYLPINNLTFINLVLYGIIYLMIFIFLTIIISLVFFKEYLINIKKYISKIIKKK